LQRCRRRYIAQHPLAHQLRGAVCIDRTRRGILGGIAIFRHAVHRGGGGKDKILDVVVDARLQQVARRAGVVALGSDSYGNHSSVGVGVGGSLGICKKTGHGDAIYVPAPGT
jgi:hypothetical protein